MTRETGFNEYYAAIDADNAWRSELDRLRVERYSVAARGAEGSGLRRLYKAKVAADNTRFNVTTTQCGAEVK